jgi:hypothetical protein
MLQLQRRQSTALAGQLQRLGEVLSVLAVLMGSLDRGLGD